MPHAVINGVRLHYEERGSGDALVFCHELAGDGRIWDFHFEALSRHYRCIRFNHRGYPPSDVPTSGDAYSLEWLVRDLAALLDRLGVDTAHLVGVATGAGVVLNFAIAHPQRARSLIVIGVGAGSDQPAASALGAMQVVRQMQAEGIAPFVRLIETGEQRQALRKKRPAAWQRFIAQVGSLSPEGCARTIEHVMVRRKPIYELEADIARLAMPVLVIVGDQDAPAIGPCQCVARNAPHGALAVLPFTGHTVPLEEPELLLALAGDFLRQVDRGAWGDWRRAAP